jgi:hypothetical protein
MFWMWGMAGSVSIASKKALRTAWPSHFSTFQKYLTPRASSVRKTTINITNSKQMLISRRPFAIFRTDLPQRPSIKRTETPESRNPNSIKPYDWRSGKKPIARKTNLKHINITNNPRHKKIEKRQQSVVFMTVEEKLDNYFWYHQKELFLSNSICKPDSHETSLEQTFLTQGNDYWRVPSGQLNTNF